MYSGSESAAADPVAVAIVIRVGKQFCVANSRTRAVLKRGGKRVCTSSKALAQKDARNTRCRITGVCPKGTTKEVLIRP